jgi:hypothetical protein
VGRNQIPEETARARERAPRMAFPLGAMGRLHYQQVGILRCDSGQHRGRTVLSAPKSIEAITFKMVVDAPYKAGHQRYRTEGHINIGLEDHLRECRECRETIVRDLRDFAEQIERISKGTW